MTRDQIDLIVECSGDSYARNCAAALLRVLHLTDRRVFVDEPDKALLSRNDILNAIDGGK